MSETLWKPILLIEMLSYCNAFSPAHQKNCKSARTRRASSYTLKPLDLLRPRARSNLRPLLMMRGFLPECGPKPKLLKASREFLGPRSSSVLAPVGER
jgi:hypothetical protein